MAEEGEGGTALQAGIYTFGDAGGSWADDLEDCAQPEPEVVEEEEDEEDEEEESAASTTAAFATLAVVAAIIA